MNLARALIQYVRFHAGRDEHLPGFITQQGIDIGLEAEASGGIIFFASDGRPTEKKVIMGFPGASDGLRHSIADAQIDWLVPATVAGTKMLFISMMLRHCLPKLLQEQKVSQYREN